MGRPISVESDDGWRLPLIEGRRVAPFVAVWSVLFAIALAASCFSAGNVIDRILAPITAPQAMGFVVADARPYPTVGTIVRTVEPRGLAGGDRILAVDGRAAKDDIVGFARQLPVRDGDRGTLLVEAPNGQPRTVTLVRDDRPFRRELHRSGLTPGLVAFGIQGLRFLFGEVLFLTAAAVLMWRRARDPLAPWASAMMVLFVLGSGGSGQWLAAQLLGDVQLIRIPNAAAYSALAVVLAVFPTGRFEPRWSMLAAAAGVAVAIGAQGIAANAGDLLIAMSQALGVATIAARFRRLPAGTSRQQMRWALLSIGASVAALLFATFCQFADRHAAGVGPDLWLRILASSFRALAHASIVLGVTVALLRYRLYDADAAITRSVAYSALTLGILATFSVSQKLIELAESRYVGAHLGPMASTLGGMLAAAMIAPLRKRTTGWAERRFRGHLTRMTTELPQLLDELRETTEPRELAAGALDAVTRAVRATRGGIVTGCEVLATLGIGRPEAETWIGSHEFGADQAAADAAAVAERDAMFPLRLPLDTRSGHRSGWLLLGPRPDGSLYGREELAALHSLIGPVSSALRIAQDRKETARILADAGREQSEQIASLRAEVSSMMALLRRAGASDEMHRHGRVGQ